MEQLISAFGINTRVLLLQALNFGILLIALTYFFYKPLIRLMEERKQKIAKGVDDAERANEKLASADVAAAKTVSLADDTAVTIVQKARDEGKEVRAEIIKDAELRGASMMQMSQKQAREMADKILRESEKSIARLAVLAAAKIIKEQ